MSKSIQIGVIGDFDPKSRYHLATNEALRHAGESLGVELKVIWLATPALDAPHPEAALEPFDGLWCAPGSPYDSLEGALGGIRFARERGRPFVGT